MKIEAKLEHKFFSTQGELMQENLSPMGGRKKKLISLCLLFICAILLLSCQ